MILAPSPKGQPTLKFTFVLFSRNDSLSRACAFGAEQFRRDGYVMADIYLGIAVTGLYTLVSMALILAFTS